MSIFDSSDSTAISMIKDIRYHPNVRGFLLDNYLNQGWFRIGQFIFTTDYIPTDNTDYRVFWLRYRLDQFVFGKKQLKLLKANNHLSARIAPLLITEELNELYQRYYNQLNFPASPTLRYNLFEFGGIEITNNNVYDTQLIEIRDGDKLVAAGVFDMGENSIAGVINFYDPQYKKLSLGKYLMLLKLEYALQHKMEFYYPGYIALNYEKFDYKLFPGTEAAEIFDPITNFWYAYDRQLMEELKDTPPPIYFTGNKERTD
jgi:leucyl-tRNA---protein transferase